MTAMEGVSHSSCSSSRQAFMSVPQGQRMWCMKAPARAREHCSKSSWAWGDILSAGRGPMAGSRQLTMKVEQRQIRPKRPSSGGTSRE